MGERVHAPNEGPEQEAELLSDLRAALGRLGTTVAVSPFLSGTPGLEATSGRRRREGHDCSCAYPIV